MGVTLLTVVQRISRPVGLNPTVSAFSDSDETNDLVQYVNEAYEELLVALPADTPYLQTSGAITTVIGTRLYNLASDAKPYNLYDWAYVDATDNNMPVQVCTLDYIMAYDPNYTSTTYTSNPMFVYLEGTQIGIYPVPSKILTLNYKYGTTYVTRLSNTTDTFIVPDQWVKFIETRAKAKYEKVKGFPVYSETNALAEQLLTTIIVDCWDMQQTAFIQEMW